jgi:hypothetical protein
MVKLLIVNRLNKEEKKKERKEEGEEERKYHSIKTSNRFVYCF